MMQLLRLCGLSIVDQSQLRTGGEVGSKNPKNLRDFIYEWPLIDIRCTGVSIPLSPRLCLFCPARSEQNKTNTT